MNPNKNFSRQGTHVDGFVEGVARILVVVGGTFQNLVRFVEAAAADVVVYLDVSNELELARPHPHVRCISLADRETIGTLVDRESSTRLDPEFLQKFKDFLKDRPGAALPDGLAQLRPVGALAALQLIESADFEQFLIKQVFEPLMVMHNGVLDQVQIVILSSQCGGTGGPGGPEIGKSMVKMLTDRSDALVSVNLLRVGSMSFMGLNNQVHLNAAATLVDDVHYVLHADRHPREVRALTLCELCMVGDSKDERDSDAVELFECLDAHQLRELIKRAGPNHAGNVENRLGNIAIFQVSWWNRIPEDAVASESASEYAAGVKQLAATKPDPTATEPVDIRTQATPAGAATLERLLATVRTARGVQPKDFYEACDRTTAEHASRAYANSRGRRNLVLSDAAVDLSDTGNTAEAIRGGLAELGALELDLRAKIQERRDRLEKAQDGDASLTSALKTEQAGLKKALKLVFPRNVLDRLKSWLLEQLKPGHVLNTFADAVTRVRELEDKHNLLQSELRALNSALANVSQAKHAVVTRLDSVLAALRPHMPSRGERKRYVVVTPLNTVLDDLVKLVPDGDEAAVRRLLGACAQAVTVDGLAAIVGAKEPHIELIAQRLAKGTPPKRGPVWGGQRPLLPGDVVTVIPPVDKATFRQLQKAVHQRNQAMVLVTADSVEGGVNAVRFEIRRPLHLNDVFTRFARNNLKIVLRTPHLFFPFGTDHVEQLGFDMELPEPTDGKPLPSFPR